MGESMSIEAGKLTHRITIQHEIEGDQDQVTGHVPVIWTEFTKVWGKLEALSTKDQLQAQAINSTMTARCRIRYSSTASQIDSTMRVLFRGKYWKIDGDPIPDNESGLEWLTLNLSEGESSWQSN
jgi:SPP1 family predicted phage head-tail adaptor